MHRKCVFTTPRQAAESCTVSFTTHVLFVTMNEWTVFWYDTERFSAVQAFTPPAACRIEYCVEVPQEVFPLKSIVADGHATCLVGLATNGDVFHGTVTIARMPGDGAAATAATPHDEPRVDVQETAAPPIDDDDARIADVFGGDGGTEQSQTAAEVHESVVVHPGVNDALLDELFG